MALNSRIIQKVEEKTIGKPQVEDALMQLLRGNDNGKYLKPIIEKFDRNI